MRFLYARVSRVDSTVMRIAALGRRIGLGVAFWFVLAAASVSSCSQYSEPTEKEDSRKVVDSENTLQRREVIVCDAHLGDRMIMLAENCSEPQKQSCQILDGNLKLHGGAFTLGRVLFPVHDSLRDMFSSAGNLMWFDVSEAEKNHLIEQFKKDLDAAVFQSAAARNKQFLANRLLHGDYSELQFAVLPGGSNCEGDCSEKIYRVAVSSLDEVQLNLSAEEETKFKLVFNLSMLFPENINDLSIPAPYQEFIVLNGDIYSSSDPELDEKKIVRLNAVYGRVGRVSAVTECIVRFASDNGEMK